MEKKLYEIEERGGMRMNKHVNPSPSHELRRTGQVLSIVSSG